MEHCTAPNPASSWQPHYGSAHALPGGPPIDAPSAAGARPGSHRAGWLAAFSSTFAFSIAAPVAAIVIGLGFDPTTIVVVRLWLAAALLFGTLALFAPAQLRLPRRALLAVAVAGPAVGLGMLLYFWSLTRLHTSIAAMLVALEPLATLLLLAARGERFTYRIAVRVALGLLGVYLLVGWQGSVDLLGVLMVLGTVLGQAYQTAALQWYLADYDGRAVTAYMVLAMAVTVSLLWLVQGLVWRPLTWPALMGIAVLVLVPTYLARLGLFAAVRRLGGGQVALLAPVETLLTVAWSVIFLGDRLTLPQLAGGGLVLLSALLAARRFRRARLPNDSAEGEILVGQ